MNEDLPPNPSALELRLKQVIRYVTLALVGILALCALLFLYIGSVKQNEQAAISNSQTQADQTKDSTFCSIYPTDEICVLSRKIAADPTQVVVPKDGEVGAEGPKGENGRGVSSFDISDEGDLVVAFSDGQTENVGKVVGKDGIDPINGIDGKDGRGILSAGIDSGNLIIRFTDGTTEDIGMVVGPAGTDGTSGVNGTNGTDGAAGPAGPTGTAGTDGISVIDLQVDSAGYVQVYYSDGQVKPAGKIIVNTISKLSCVSDTLTITMVDGSFLSTPVDCTPDNLPIGPAAKQPETPVTIP